MVGAALHQRNRPGYPRPGRFYFEAIPLALARNDGKAAHNRCNPAAKYDTPFECEALGSIDRDNSIGVTCQQAKSTMRAPGAASLRMGAASRISGASRIFAKIN